MLWNIFLVLRLGFFWGGCGGWGGGGKTSCCRIRSFSFYFNKGMGPGIYFFVFVHLRQVRRNFGTCMRYVQHFYGNCGAVERNKIKRLSKNVIVAAKNWLYLVLEGLAKRIKLIGLFVKYAQCVSMSVYLVFIILGMQYSLDIYIVDIHIKTFAPRYCTLIFVSQSFSKEFLALDFVVNICYISC